MGQSKSFTWTNAASAVARNLDCGFTVGEITTTDVTNGAQWYWNSQMDDASSIRVSTGAFSASNGFTPLSQNAQYFQEISAFTNANPGVITVNDAVLGGYAAGDTIQVVGLADDQSGTTLNGSYTIASITGNAITTGTNTSSYSVYVSGGLAVRETDTNGDPVPFENKAIRGITVGTTPVGANSAEMVAVAREVDYS